MYEVNKAIAEIKKSEPNTQVRTVQDEIHSVLTYSSLGQLQRAVESTKYD